VLKAVSKKQIEFRIVTQIYIAAVCGHSFVMNLSFSHTLSPSAKSSSQLAIELVRTLAPEQRQELQLQLSIL